MNLELQCSGRDENEAAVSCSSTACGARCSSHVIRPEVTPEVRPETRSVWASLLHPMLKFTREKVKFLASTRILFSWGGEFFAHQTKMVQGRVSRRNLGWRLEAPRLWKRNPPVPRADPPSRTPPLGTAPAASPHGSPRDVSSDGAVRKRSRLSQYQCSQGQTDLFHTECTKRCLRRRINVSLNSQVVALLHMSNVPAQVNGAAFLHN